MTPTSAQGLGVKLSDRDVYNIRDVYTPSKGGKIQEATVSTPTSPLVPSAVLAAPVRFCTSKELALLCPVAIIGKGEGRGL